ncbi:ribonuclease H1 [Rhizodiscina lignyota]|uniref:ribonuclease H n=1 Tax=Rhizodiscina lignyota TaxID=1504668 RepID=A0A9P4MA85_9PEZI|nr:ribonuclease H1 [Rhizodiscina lignyota]
MPYIFEIYVDGGRRRNGQDDAFGAAAVVFKRRNRSDQVWWREIPNFLYQPVPTNQRAELTAAIMALEIVLEKYDALRGTPWINVTIYTDSHYVVGCMTKWIHKWQNNGWINAAGRDVANRDLIEEAAELDARVCAEGNLTYTWIPRAENSIADKYCNDCLDQQEDERY